MEVVLLWLDELDDSVFVVALVWERLRRILLQIGLAASGGLAASEGFAVATAWAPVLAAVSAAAVGCWLVGAAFRAFRYNERSPLSAA